VLGDIWSPAEALKWNGEWQARTAETDQYWTAEVFIPWKTVGVEPGKRCRMGLNVSRKHAPVDAVEVQSYTPGGVPVHGVGSYLPLDVDLTSEERQSEVPQPPGKAESTSAPGSDKAADSAPAVRPAAEHKSPNLLPNPGFENLEESFIEEGTVLQKGQSAHFRGWSAMCEEGRLKVSGDVKEVSEGETSLKIQFLSPDSDNRGRISCSVSNVKPNTIYKLRGMIKAINIDWVISQCRMYEHAKGGEQLRGTIRRLMNYPTSRQFLERKTWFTTGSRAHNISLMMYWKGRPLKSGIVQQPSVIWLDDLKLVEVGPVYPASGQYLQEDFEGEGLKNWLLAQAGADWRPTDPGFGDKRNPQISEEQAHSGKRSLKLFPTWGVIERPFAEEITNCVVTAWFYEKPSDRCRMVMLVDEDGMEVGLGSHYESVSNYSFSIGGKQQVTDIEKSVGWHELKWDVTEGRGVTCYIDGVKVGQTDRLDGFRTLRVGQSFWRGSLCYVDDISIQPKEPQ